MCAWNRLREGYRRREGHRKDNAVGKGGNE